MIKQLISICTTLMLFTTLMAAHQGEIEPELKVGQKWSYSARPGEEASYFIIVKIDNDAKLGKIIHISMRGLKIKNPHSPDGFSSDVGHLPFAEEAIRKSGLKLLKEKVDLPEFKDGYRMWREAFDSGRAGVYSITVAEAVGVMETTLNR